MIHHHAGSKLILQPPSSRRAGKRPQPARERAYMSAWCGAPVKATPAALQRAMPVKDAFSAVMRAGIAHLQANKCGVLKGRDPEYLHQLRVAVRRQRSAFSVFKPVIPGKAAAPFVAEFKWLASCLGPARDWDVFLTQTLPLIEKEFGDHGAPGAFRARCRELQRKAGAHARRAVRSARYQRLISTLNGWLETWSERIELDFDQRACLGEPIHAFASKVLDQSYRQVRKRGRKLEKLSNRRLHRLRIAVKKFRYATDFFASLCVDGRARATLHRLSGLQDILGAINDAAMAKALVGRGTDGAGQKKWAARTRGVVRGWSRGEAARLRGELKGAWEKFRSADRFWRQEGGFV